MFEKKVIVLEFLMKDSLPEFWFSFHSKDELRDIYIFGQNKRIIGYFSKNNVEIVLLSRINYKYEFEERFCKFIYPTNDNLIFDYIYFPDNQYKMYEYLNYEGEKPMKINCWPELPGIYDYRYSRFKYLDNHVVN